METIGSRIALLRTQLGWTQQYLADRLGISRVAVSHFESDIALPNERTILLLAGLFKQTPLSLVDHTTYPISKAERLPRFVTMYTETEVVLIRLQNDFDWISKIHSSSVTKEVINYALTDWRLTLTQRLKESQDQEEIVSLRKALDRVIGALSDY